MARVCSVVHVRSAQAVTAICVAPACWEGGASLRAACWEANYGGASLRAARPSSQCKAALAGWEEMLGVIRVTHGQIIIQGGIIFYVTEQFFCCGIFLLPQ